MSGFRILDPMTVTDSVFVSSSVPENDFAEWNPATAYTVGQRVIRASLHRVYQRQIAGTTATAPENDPINWVYVSPTNRWKMFDAVNSTATTSNSTISVVLSPSVSVNGLALLGLFGTSARIRVVDPIKGTTFDQTRTLSGQLSAATWFNYFFDYRLTYSQFVALNIPVYSSSSTIYIDVTPVNGVASIGTFLMGYVAEFGQGVNYGAKVGIRDFSKKTKNQFGDTILVEGAFSRRGSFDLFVPSLQTDVLISKLTALRAKPALYVATDKYEATTIYGTYSDFDMVISFPDTDVLNIQLEGLT